MQVQDGYSNPEVFVLAASTADSQMAVAVLRKNGINAFTFADLDGLISEIRDNTGALLIAEEIIFGSSRARLLDRLERQEAWSDLPVLLITSKTTSSSFEPISERANISLLERPFAQRTLLGAIHAALRARARQYQVQNLLKQQLLATQKRDEFFATLSHELRTPLNVILGWLDMLRNEDLSPEVQANALQILERNALVQKGLIDDLLDISRIITGKLIFNFQPVSLTKLVRSCVESLRPKAQEKQLTIHLDLFPGPCVFEGDEMRFEQVLFNLLTNSIKFTPEGGRISVRVEAENSSYRLTVEDSGQGVDPEFLPHIFDRLRQEDMSMTRGHGGLGLGLAIAAHIVKEHHGRIRAQSAGRGTGTTMQVDIPASRLSLAPGKLEIESKKLSLQGTRILVVDDSLDILELMKIWLKPTGAEVLLLDSGRRALEALHTFKPNLILSDIGMPDLDGYQLMARIRALPATEGGSTPAVALTAYARDEEKERAIRAGYQIHVSKPLNNMQLVSAIHRALVLKSDCPVA